MGKPQQKLVQYLSEAHAAEQALLTTLQSQIAMTPAGSYRDGLESHVRETRDHARRVQRRLDELRQGSNPLQAGLGLVQTVVGHALALGKTPLDLVRGTGGEEKVLKNAKDACATEALEIATYTAIERLASSVGDKATAALAESIRADEQRMLERILREIPKLTEAVVRSEIRGEPLIRPHQDGCRRRGPLRLGERQGGGSGRVVERQTNRPQGSQGPRRRAGRGPAEGRAGLRRRPGDHRLREADRCGDRRQAPAPLAGRPREDRLLRAQERQPYDDPQPDHRSARPASRGRDTTSSAWTRSARCWTRATRTAPSARAPTSALTRTARV